MFQMSDGQNCTIAFCTHIVTSPTHAPLVITRERICKHYFVPIAWEAATKVICAIKAARQNLGKNAMIIARGSWNIYTTDQEVVEYQHYWSSQQQHKQRRGKSWLPSVDSGSDQVTAGKPQKSGWGCSFLSTPVLHSPPSKKQKEEKEITKPAFHHHAQSVGRRERIIVTCGHLGQSLGQKRKSSAMDMEATWCS